MNYQQLRSEAQSYNLPVGRKTKSQIKSALNKAKYPHKFKIGETVTIPYQYDNGQQKIIEGQALARIYWRIPLPDYACSNKLPPKYSVFFLNIQDNWKNEVGMTVLEDEIINPS